MKSWIDAIFGSVLLLAFFGLVVLVAGFRDNEIVRRVFIGPGFILTGAWIALLAVLSFKGPKIADRLAKGFRQEDRPR